VNLLPGLTDCGPPVDVPWLSVSRASGTVEPGHRQVVRVTLTAAKLTRPGTYLAQPAGRCADAVPRPENHRAAGGEGALLSRT
jgi:hypothetical protein